MSEFQDFIDECKRLHAMNDKPALIKLLKIQRQEWEEEIRIFTAGTEFLSFTNYHHPQPILIDGLPFRTAISAFQSGKLECAIPPLSDDEIEKRRILFANADAKEAFKMGRTLQIDTKKWDDMKDEVMKEVMKKMVSENDDIKEALLKTGDRDIICDCLSDQYWSTPNNTCGILWEIVRTDLFQITTAKKSKNDQSGSSSSDSK